MKNSVPPCAQNELTHKSREPDAKRDNIETDEYVEAARERHGIKSLPDKGSNLGGHSRDQRYGNEYERGQHARIKGDTTRNPFAKP